MFAHSKQVRRDIESTDEYASACALLVQGDRVGGLAMLDAILAASPHKERERLFRAKHREEAGSWDGALADYEFYIRHGDQAKRSKQLAGAYYGASRCLAKMGDRLSALHHLDLCIAAAPRADEQLGDREASDAPRAVVARTTRIESMERAEPTPTLLWRPCAATSLRSRFQCYGAP